MSDESPYVEVSRFVADVCGAVRLLRDGIATGRSVMSLRLDPLASRELDAFASGALEHLEGILRLCRDGSPAVTTAGGPPVATAAPATRVLIVDDSDYSREAAAHVVRTLGLAVDEAQSGEAAIMMAARTKYSLILMDLQMPGMDGVRTTEAIRRAETGARTPIVALTGVQVWESRDECMAAGMDGYLLKPLRLAELRSTVRRLIEG